MFRCYWGLSAQHKVNTQYVLPNVNPNELIADTIWKDMRMLKQICSNTVDP